MIDRQAHSTVVRWLASALLIVAALEFLTLRVLLRSSPALDEGHAGPVVAEIIVLLGLIGMTAAVLLAGGLVALVSLRMLTGRATLPILAGAAGLGLLALLVIATLPVAPSGALLAPTMLLTAFLVGSVLVTRAGALGGQVVVVLFGGTALLVVAVHLLRGLSVTGMSVPSGVALYHVAEGLAVAAAIGAVALVRRPLSRWAIPAGLLAGSLFLGWHAAIPWLPATVAIWNLGLSLYLPVGVYAFALAVFVAVVTHLARQDARLAIALLLIAMGGLKWDVPYLHLLGVAGLLLLIEALRAAEAREPVALAESDTIEQPQSTPVSPPVPARALASARQRP